MAKSYFIATILSLGLFYWIFQEYYDHLGAFDDQQIVKSTVQKIHCGKRSNIRTSDLNTITHVRLSRKKFLQLTEGDVVSLIRGKSGKLYWNEKPTDRIFWLIPIYLLLISYIFYWHYRKKKIKISRQ